ncbi:MAG: hypothetical protein ACI9OJ_001004 [Myxococcota bacterium]|jgi:hypothetical protein
MKSIFAVLIVLALVGCPDDPDAASSTVDVVTNSDTGAVFDLGPQAVPDGTGGTVGGETVNSPDSDDVGDECGGLPPACVPTDSASSGHMCPCTDNSDCDSGLCVTTADGRVCTEFCEECCPGGFRCALLSGAGADTKFACLPTHLNLCRPCTTNAECQDLALPGNDRCISGPNGSFCGSGCGQTSDCPAGYGCLEVSGQDGGLIKQCVPTSGECLCSDLAIGQGASTNCEKSNEVGTCTGTRGCSADGLSSCNSAEPTVESCNGLDDDCDGVLDNDSCPAGELCQCVGDECGCGCPPGLTLCGDECVDTTVSATHCGGCDTTCEMPNVATTICDGGECKIVKCDAGFEDADPDVAGCECAIKEEICDNLDNDCDGQTDEESGLCAGTGGCDGQCLAGQCVCPGGCDQCFGTCVPPETYQTDETNCGFCGVKCTDENLPNVVAYACEGGGCGIGKCKNPYVDVNGETFDGCECQKTATVETCDGVDNDCDGVIDEFTEPCSTDCGVGVRKCSGGFWEECNAANPKTCMDWGSCEMTDVCVDFCPSAPAEICNAVDDNCNDDTDEGFACIPGALTEEPCGNCGTQKLICDDTCGWILLGECTSGGACEPGALDDAPCGQCGTKNRICLDSCGWGDFSECTSEGVCGAGETQSEPCGACGSRMRSCTEGCGWTDWGECSGEGGCTPGENQTQGCGACGSQARTCGSSCDWEDWSVCAGEGVCAVGDESSLDCGNCGSQARSCTALCEWEDTGGCSDQGPCAPGDDDAQSCGNCGAQTRLCTNACTWEDWGTCTDGGQCTVGTDEVEDCGMCGTRSRACGGSCLWDDWGTCGGQGVCVPGDVETEACGSCGSRQRTCSDSCGWGAWSDCGGQGICLPNDVDNQGCESCGNQSRTCTSSCSWGGWSICGGQGICTPGAEETEACGSCGTRKRTCSNGCGWGDWSSCSGEGICAPGATSAQSCGDCGSETRTCTSQCTWGGFGSCGGEGICAPGDVVTQACGNCGTRTQTCTSQCGWSTFSACSDQGQCVAGSTSTQSCGNCGSQSRTCSSQCTWNDFGSCGSQGACSPGATESQGCGNCGSETRTCNASCGWSGYGSCGGQGVCAAGATENCPAACGTRSCSGSCGWNSCNFTLDTYEPNESYTQAKLLGSYSEGDSITPLTSAWLHQAEPGFADPGEIDRFYFNCAESGNIFDGSMAMGASLSGIGGWHSLCIFYDRGCNGGVDVQNCSTGYGALGVSTGDVDSQNGSDDDGCIDVEIFGDASCAAYILQLSCD